MGKNQTIYVVKFKSDKGNCLTEVVASSYMEAVKDIPTWIAVVKKPKDLFD